MVSLDVRLGTHLVLALHNKMWRRTVRAGPRWQRQGAAQEVHGCDVPVDAARRKLAAPLHLCSCPEGLGTPPAFRRPRTLWNALNSGVELYTSAGAACPRVRQIRICMYREGVRLY